MLPSDAFRLGPLTVVPSLNRLAWADRADDLEPRVMRVLAVLAETPGEVVARNDLLDAVWGDTVVNEDALTRAVSELRKALRDEAGAIETIRGRGYRLRVPVQPVSSHPPNAAVASQSSGGTPPTQPESVDRLPAGASPTQETSVRTSPAGGRPTQTRLAEGSLADRPPAPPSAPRASRRPGPFVLLALGVASLALVVALWAVRPSPLEEPGTSAFDALRSGDLRADDEPFRLDSTSPFYRPGMSEFGVYYDSTMDRYFRMVPSGSQDLDTTALILSGP